MTNARDTFSKWIVQFSTFIFIATFQLTIAYADLSVHALFTDNGVLQQNQPVPIWGTAEPMAEITVKFGAQSVSTKATENGDWMVSLANLVANSVPTNLFVRSGTEQIVVNGMLVGEVWVCSGQSNMAMQMRRTLGYATVQEEVASGSLANIRLFKVPVAGSDVRITNVEAQWSKLDEKSVSQFSATGLYFGRALSQELNVPVGLIQSANGGTNAYSWINSDTYKNDIVAKPSRKFWEETVATSHSKLAKFQEEKLQWRAKLKSTKPDGKVPPGRAPKEPLHADHVKRPAAHYNAMVVPLQPFAIAGVIWYQGEANAKPGFASNYKDLMLGLVDDWRGDWAKASNTGKRNFPFYIVQLPNYARGHEDGWPLIREQMLQFWIEGQKTGMVTTIDVGDPTDIHPQGKMPVGDRLAIFALGDHYKNAVVFSGPILKSVTVENGKGIFTFQHAGSGLCSLDGKPLRHFQIADAAGNFVDAEATIEDNRLIVYSPAIAAPHAVRYAWSNNPENPNFGNQDGLLASPFRTDRWKINVD